MWLVDDVADYIRENWNNWRAKKALEKKTYQEAYMEKKLELLKDKAAIDAKAHVFGKDAVNFNNYQKPFDNSTR